MTSTYVHDGIRYDLNVGRNDDGYISWIVLYKDGIVFRGEVNLFKYENTQIVNDFLNRVPSLLRGWLTKDHPLFFRRMFTLSS